MVEQAKEKKNKVQLGEFMNHVRGPSWRQYIKKTEKTEKKRK